MNETESPTPTESGGPDSLEDLLKQVPRLSEGVFSYLQAYLKKFTLSLQQDLLQTLFWIFLVILLFQVTYLALSLVVRGAGEGLGLVLGNRVWLGNLIAGGALIVLLLLFFKVGLWALHRSLKKKSLEPAIVEREIQQTLVAMQEDFRGVFQVKAWVERYPLPTTGAVAVLGFWMGGNLFHSSETKPISGSAEVPGAGSVSIPWIASLSNVLLTTFSDVLKDAAHLWLQENLSSFASQPVTNPDAECPPPAP